MLPQLLPCDCLHAPPPLRVGSPLASPTTRYSPARHHPTRNTHHPCTAGVRKHPTTAQLPPMSCSVPLRSSDISCVILPRLGASDAAPAELISLPARTFPLGSPHAELPPPATAPRATAPAHSTQHHQRTAGVRKHPLPAQLPADARSVPRRFSDVSCVILSRLGASDAAPAASMLLSARTAAPRLAPRRTPHHPLQPRAHPPQPTARNIISAFAGVRKHPLPAQLPPMLQRTEEVQRRQLRHPSETRCQRHCPI